MSNPFEEYVFEAFSNAISNWDTDIGIYAIGFDIFCVEDDLRRPAVRLIRNTLSHARLHSPSPSGAEKDFPGICLSKGKVSSCLKKREADSSLEALWNHSFWDFTTYSTVGTEFPDFLGDYVDFKGIELRRNWIENLGLWYDDEFEHEHFDESLEIGGQIVNEFDKLCLRVAYRISPYLSSKFKNNIPIIFFGREELDNETIALTFLANSLQEIKGYVEYVSYYCGSEWRSLFDWLDVEIERKPENLEVLLNILLGG